jgi:hypothetical protein
MSHLVLGQVILIGWMLDITEGVVYIAKVVGVA